MTDALTFPSWPRAFVEPTTFRCATCDGVWVAPVDVEVARPVCTGLRHGRRHGMTHMTQIDDVEARPTHGLEVAA